MRLRWVLLLLLGLNLAYLGSGLYRAQLTDAAFENPPLQRAPGVRDIRLIDSLADTPAYPAAGNAGVAAGVELGPEAVASPR